MLPVEAAFPLLGTTVPAGGSGKLPVEPGPRAWPRVVNTNSLARGEACARDDVDEDRDVESAASACGGDERCVRASVNATGATDVARPSGLRSARLLLVITAGWWLPGRSSLLTVVLVLASAV